MSSNDTESVSDCTTESHCAEFLNVCALESDSSSGSRISSNDDNADRQTKTRKKYCPVKSSSISPPQFLSKENIRRKSSCSGFEEDNMYMGYKKASLSAVNFNFALDQLFPDKVVRDSKTFMVPVEDDADNEHEDDNKIGFSPYINKHENTLSDTTPCNSRKSSVNGVVKHRGRRFKVASKEKIPEFSIEPVSKPANNKVNIAPVFPPRPPKEKNLSTSDNVLMQSFVNRMHEGNNNISFKPPPAIDVIAPSPTLSSLSSSLGKSTPTHPAPIPEESQSLKPSMLCIKSPSSNDWLSSGSSSGTISPISCTLRCPSTASNSSGEGRSPLPPLKNTPVLRRRNLLPPICRQETLSPSSCSSHGSASRTPSPGSGKLPSPSKEFFPERSANNSPTTRQRSTNISPLLQYVISQQSMHHPPEQFPMPQNNTVNSTTDTERRKKTGSKKYRRSKRGEHESSGSSHGSVDGEGDSLTSTSSLDVAPRSPEDDALKEATSSAMFLPDIKRKSLVKSKVFEGLASDLNQMTIAQQTKSNNTVEARPGRRSSRKLSVVNSSLTNKMPKETRNRMSNEELGTTPKGRIKLSTSSKSLDFTGNSPSNSPLVRRKVTRKEDKCVSVYFDKRHSQQENASNNLRQLLHIKTCNRE